MTAEARTGARAGDLWGGLAAMLVAAPSALGYGVTIYAAIGPEHAGQGALAGILGCVAIGLLAPPLGGTPRLVSAPCGPAAVLLAAAAASMAAAGIPPLRIALLLGFVGLFASALQIIYGVLGGGRLIKFIPYPVVAGYLSGVGVLLFAGQVPKLLGLPPDASGWAGLVSPSQWGVPGLAVGLATIGGLLGGPRLTKKVPAVILGLASGFLTYALLAAFLPELRRTADNPLVVGAFGATAPDPAGLFADRVRHAAALTLDDLAAVWVPAVTLSVLLSIDTLKTCVILDALTRSRHDSNRELRAQGVGNFASALLGGMPGAGTMGATLVNLNSGGTTRASGAWAGIFALPVLVFGTGFLPGIPNLLAWIPKAALAGIILVVAFRMIDWHSFSLLKHRSTVLDFGVILAVVVTAVLASLVVASAVGLALAIVLFMRDLIRGTVIRRKHYGNQVFSRRHRPPAQTAVLQEQGNRTVVCALQGTLFFGTTDQLMTLLEEDLKTCRHVLLDLRRVQSLDYTAAHMLEQIAATLTERGAWLAFSNLPAHLPTGQDLNRYFDQLGLVSRDRNVRVFDDLDGALQWAEDRTLEAAGLGDNPSAPPIALREFEVFREFDADSLDRLAACVRERSVGTGEAVFRHGEAGDEIFLVRRGAVEIVLPLAGGRRHPLSTFSRGSFFGDMAFLDRSGRSADAVALKPTDLFVLSRADFDAFSRSRPDAGAMLFGRLARILAVRLRQTDAELRAMEEA
jgi:SulP family sulfate permease